MSEPYVHYEFVYVKCNKCNEKSNDFVYKDHLTADEQLTYISEITGFSVQKDEIENPTEKLGFVNTGKNADKGGMICPTCQGIENTVGEVANG